MRKLQLVLSDGLYAEIHAVAERDSPGAPKHSTAAVRLVAMGLKEEKRLRGELDVPPHPKIETPPAPQEPEGTVTRKKGTR